jgi:hypothetical protein
MYIDPEDIDVDAPDGVLASERLVREGGVFVEPPHYEVEVDRAPHSSDDDPEDLGAGGRPGTPDDIGYAYGTVAPETEDLWDLQQALLEEDEENAVLMPVGTEADHAARVLGLMGDEVADFMPEGQKSSSATGESTTAPDRGGFPERSE